MYIWVRLAYLIYLVPPVQPKTPDKPNKPKSGRLDIDGEAKPQKNKLKRERWHS